MCGLFGGVRSFAAANDNPPFANCAKDGAPGFVGGSRCASLSRDCLAWLIANASRQSGDKEMTYIEPPGA